LGRGGTGDLGTKVHFGDNQGGEGRGTVATKENPVDGAAVPKPALLHLGGMDFTIKQGGRELRKEGNVVEGNLGKKVGIPAGHGAKGCPCGIGETRGKGEE